MNWAAEDRVAWFPSEREQQTDRVDVRRGLIATPVLARPLMKTSLHSRRSATTRSRLRVYNPDRPSTPQVAGLTWLIDGFPAKLSIWTDDQWARLEVRPDDAQRHPLGLWCTFSMV